MSETFMVVDELNTEEQYAVISTPKLKTKIRVYKPRYQYHFFKIKYESAITPECFSGQYSSLDAGIKAVKQHLLTSEESFAVRSDRLDKERKERHAAKANTSNSK